MQSFWDRAIRKMALRVGRFFKKSFIAVINTVWTIFRCTVCTVCDMLDGLAKMVEGMIKVAKQAFKKIHNKMDQVSKWIKTEWYHKKEPRVCEFHCGRFGLTGRKKCPKTVTVDCPDKCDSIIHGCKTSVLQKCLSQKVKDGKYWCNAPPNSAGGPKGWWKDVTPAKNEAANFLQLKTELKPEEQAAMQQVTDFLEQDMSTEQMQAMTAEQKQLFMAKRILETDHDELLGRIANKQSFLQIGAGVMTQLEAHLESKEAAAENAMHLHNLKLGHMAPATYFPNKCVNDEKLGKSFDIVLNFENPNLLEALCNPIGAIAKGDLLPEFLVAVVPKISDADGEWHLEDSQCEAGNCGTGPEQTAEQQLKKSAEQLNNAAEGLIQKPTDINNIEDDNDNAPVDAEPKP